MDTFELQKDIKVFYIAAKTFPEGICEATDKLHELAPFSQERNYFGISCPENGRDIVYKASAEEMKQGEAEKFKCETLWTDVIEKGRYVYRTAKNFRKDVMAIDRVFKELLNHPGLDPEGYCVEWYTTDSETVKCMIRLNQ